MGSLVLQTAIGLIFIFGITAAAVSAVTEVVSRFLGLRAEYLLRGVRTLTDGQSDFGLPWRSVMPKALGGRPEDPPADLPSARVTQIMSHPLVASSARQAHPPREAGNFMLTSAQRRRLPSYMSGETFARVLLDILPGTTEALAQAQDQAQGQAQPAAQRGRGARGGHAAQADADRLAAIRSWADAKASPEPPHKPDPLAQALRPLLRGVDDVQGFATNVSRWYDDHMDRVSGWYKRHVRWISLAVGLLLVLAFNVNTIRVTDSLYSNQAVQGSVVTVAAQKTSCRAKQPVDCLAALQAKVGQFGAFGLPVGWGDLPVCAGRGCSFLDRHGLTSIGRNGINDVWAFLLVLLGWLLTVAALTPGARFWFDLLSRLGSLRSTGPKPSSSG
ncbi:MAG TPA: hypothetical protein VLW44_12585 [Streptosporangiaceae bacterium]|nr:hypothetical protein [Streptosporangiaceae bacterium]